MKQFAAISVAIGCLAAPPALADDIHVPDDHSTIQAAIDAAVDGDTIIVADDTYTGEGNRDLDFGGRAITLQSANGKATCIIDIQGSEKELHRAFWFHSGETAASVVEGFTIINGVMDAGGAMLIENGSSPTIVSCSFEGNTANPTVESTGGGAVAIFEGQPTFYACEFIENHVNALSNTGGGALHVQFGSGTFTGCVFSENSVLEQGGAVRNTGGSLTFTKCAFTGNTSTFFGGALVGFANAQMELIECTFENNFAQTGGGGVGLEDAGTHAMFSNCQFGCNSIGINWGGGALRVGVEATADVIDCAFIGNTAPFGPGAAVHTFNGAQITFTSTLFQGNESGESGGAVSLWASSAASFANCLFDGNQSAASGGAVSIVSSATGSFTNCQFQGNQAGAGGGAVRIESSAAGSFTNCPFQGNQAPGSGGAVSLLSDGALTNCLFHGNQAGNRGGTVNIGADGSARLDNCTIAQNVAGVEGGGVRVGGGAIQTCFSNSILWDNAPEGISWGGSPLSVTYSDIEGGWAGTGNIDLDPLFVDPEDNDYRLSSGSDCIDAADNTTVPEDVTTDLDDNPRFVDDPDARDSGNSDEVNSQVDMGTYEFCRADTNRDGTVDVQDLVNVILAWGSGDVGADTNADGIVDVQDIVSVIVNWGSCQ